MEEETFDNSFIETWKIDRKKDDPKNTTVTQSIQAVPAIQPAYP